MLRHQKGFSPGTSLDAHYDSVASVTLELEKHLEPLKEP